MALVVSGLLNKQVGTELGISEITVKAHRGQIMRKMKANSFADLVRMAASLRPGRQDNSLGVTGEIQSGFGGTLAFSRTWGAPIGNKFGVAFAV
jgi:hypothetical protein